LRVVLELDLYDISPELWKPWYKSTGQVTSKSPTFLKTHFVLGGSSLQPAEALSQTRAGVAVAWSPSAAHPSAGIAALSARLLALDGFARCCVAQSPQRGSVAGDLRGRGLPAPARPLPGQDYACSRIPRPQLARSGNMASSVSSTGAEIARGSAAANEQCRAGDTAAGACSVGLAELGKRYGNWEGLRVVPICRRDHVKERGEGGLHMTVQLHFSGLVSRCKR